MSFKPRPNHARYIEALRRMAPEQRLRKAFELTDMSRDLLVKGLERRFPDRTPEQIRELARQRIELCRNRSF